MIVDRRNILSRKVLLVAALLVMAGFTAFAEPRNVLLDQDHVKGMTEAEYLAAVRNAENVRARDDKGRTALHWAAAFGTPNIVTALIDAGADVNARTAYGGTPLHYAAESAKPEVVTSLIGAGADVNAHTDDGVTPIHVAAGFGAPEVVTALIEAGAKVGALERGKETPLHWAVRHGRPKRIVTALIEAGADVNAPDWEDYTPLHLAGRHAKPEVVTALIEAGADVNARTERGATPLHWAALSKTPEVLTALIDAGTDVNARSDSGSTPLHRAARFGRPAIVTALLDAGASGHARNDDGLTPFDVAAENEKLKGTDALRELSDAQRPPEGSNDAVAPAPKIESRRGGWQGGDVEMVCYAGETTYRATILLGDARIKINSIYFDYSFLTYIPEGFVMSNWIDGRFVTLRMEPHQHQMIRTEHNAPDGSRDTRVQCEFCPRPLDRRPIRELGLSFNMPSGEWCPFLWQRIEPFDIRLFIRPVLDLAQRKSKGGVLTSAERAHIFSASVGIGPVSEADQKITSGIDLRRFVEREMGSGRIAAKRSPGWITILLGPYEGQVGYHDFVVDSWRFVPDIQEQLCVSLERRTHSLGDNRANRQKRRACLDPSRGLVFAADFSDTRLLGDPDADSRAARWSTHADAFLNSIRFSQ